MKKLIAVLIAVALLLGTTKIASANHSWGGYHWARTANPFTLQLGNNTSGTWTSLLGAVSTDWSASTVLDTTFVPGGTKAKPCRPTLGRDEICNANYGNTGWLGVAQIWIYSDGHIAQGTVKNNDYYFGSSSYQFNNEAEKRHVICQEVGHTLGLDHQSTDGSSLNTCMDYYHNTSAIDTASTHPNQHDYDELGIIYAHTDSFNSVFSSLTGRIRMSYGNPDLNQPTEWGKLVRSDAHETLYEQDLGAGNKLFTFVTWAR